ncbi:MAG: HNH endonuclease [Candidatus Omnitrophica bacterium]|nr:HNH endonuclease [Candidatus Omnitrophota bacterium]
MKKTKLTRGKVALVDDEDYERTTQYRWCAMHINYQWYADRALSKKEPKNAFTEMHRFIMNPPKGMMVDHRDGNGLNNQKSNLRICTRAENMMNRGKQPNNTSGYKGVRINKGIIIAQIGFKNWNYHIGCFPDKESAARAYDKRAKELFGDFARLNFPKED